MSINKFPILPFYFSDLIVFIPLVLYKLNIDSAVATGPFITTTNDILGLLIHMTVAQMFFKIL